MIALNFACGLFNVILELISKISEFFVNFQFLKLFGDRALWIKLTSNSQCSWDWPSLPASTSQVQVLQVEHPLLVPRVLESEDTSQILLSRAFPAFRLPTVGRLFYILIMLLQTRSFVAAYLNQMFHKATPPQVGALHSRMCSVLFDIQCWEYFPAPVWVLLPSAHPTLTEG